MTTFVTVASGLVLALATYILSLAVYRLYSSPLTKFPGPRVTALSWWDEAYYSIFLRGQHAFRLDDLHVRYGSIVRITPEEVHIKDSSFWEEVFVRRPKANKDPSLVARFGDTRSTFSTMDATWHKRLRAPLNPFFSRRSILAQENLVQDKVELLCKGFERCHSNSSIISISGAFAALTADVISHYSFGFSYGQLESEDWKDNLQSVYTALGEFGHILVQFPWLNPLIMSLPDFIVTRMDPDFGRMLQLKTGLRETITRIRKDRDVGDSKETSRTIFHALLSSDLPASDKTDSRLGDEAHTVIGAGIVTTAWALTNAVYYILADPSILSTLYTELYEAIPDISKSHAFGYEKLERLPYLRGCVKEGIRHSYGLSGRLGRIFQEPLLYKDWSIPPGTTVSMSSRDVSFDEDIFENAQQFKPERWMLGESKTKDGSALESYFLPFSSGPRMCLGINLAYLEMYVVLAHIFRRFSLRLYETDASDVLLAHDFFTPSPRLDSKGVRVKILDTFQ